MISVNVQIMELEIGTRTDEKGGYRFQDVPPGTYTVRFTFISYKVLSRSVTLSDRPVTLNVDMEVQPVEADVVTITGEREVPTGSRSVSVLEAEELAENRGQTLGETLESVSGVTSLTTGPAVSKPVVRGLHSQRVLILNADVAHEGQQWGGDHAPEIDPFAPARIEVLKGAAGVQYGAGAIGGVIRVLPQELRSDPGFSGDLSLNAFSNNRQGAASLMLEGGAKQIRGLGWRAQGSIRRAGDSRSPTHVLENTGFDEKDWAFALGINRERAGIEAYYSHFGTDLGIYRNAHIGNTTNLLEAIQRGQPESPGDFSYTIDSPKQAIRHDLFSLRSRYRFQNVGSIEVNYAQQYNKRQEFDAHDPTKPGFDLGLLSRSGEIIFQHAPTAHFLGKIGVVGQRQRNTRFSSGFLIPDFLAYTAGIFGYEQWHGERWTFEGGLRYDYRWQNIVPNAQNRVPGGVQTYSNFSGAIGATYDVTPELAVSANIGQAWRPPSVNELFSSGLHHGSAQIELGDPTLGNESSLNTDLTLRYKSERIQGEISGYYTRFKNFVNLFPEKRVALTIRGAFPVFSYAQGNADFRGFDGNVELEINEYLGMHASAAIVRAQNHATDEPLILITPDRYSVGAEVAFPEFDAIPEHGLDIDVSIVTQQTRFPANADFVDPPSGYQVVDFHYSAALSSRPNPVRIQAGVHNLFNARYRDYLSRYRYFIDDPGRDITVRVSVPFGTPE